MTLLIAITASSLAGVGPALASPTCKGLSVTIQGGPADETLTGTRGRDVIHGGPGDDVVSGRGGNDVLCGGPGVDEVTGGAGADRVFGNEDPDVLAGGPGNDFLDGEEGHDVASFESATRSVKVDLAARAAAGEGADSLAGIESAVGGAGDDVIRGTRRTNLLVGGVGDDRLLGLGGADVVQPLEGDDFADGGAGKDALSYSLSTGAVAIDPVDGDGTERLRGFEALQGSQFDDVIRGTERADVLLGFHGADEFHPGMGDDVVDGQGRLTDLDEVVYEDVPRRVVLDLQVLPDAPVGVAKGAGEDVLAKIDHAVGTRFDDVLRGRNANDVLAGLAGDDRIRIGLGGTATGGDGDDTLVGTGNLSGDDGDDELTAVDDVLTAELSGGRGHDVLTGAGAADFFHPGPGNDTVSGGDPAAGAANGLATQDRVSYSTAPNGVVVDLAAGTATGEGTDALSGVEDVVGSAFDDSISGNDLHNNFFAGAGADRLESLGAADLLDGGAGDDVMDGGDGDDLLVGGDGTDSADGGPGGDTCDAEQTVDCERSLEPSVARQASRWERHLRKISHAITDSGNVTSPTSPISEFRNRSLAIRLR